MSEGLAFIDRQPTFYESERLRLILSTFCDGSGMNDGGSRPGWRDVERTVAASFDGTAPENKDVFDVFLRRSPQSDVGFSIKCKSLAGNDALARLAVDGRCYMELANSPAKFWAELTKLNLSEDDFRDKRSAAKFGAAVLATVDSWHIKAADTHYKMTGRTLDLGSSYYLTLSSGARKGSDVLLYQWHSFPLAFPSGVSWKFKSGKCLSGYDPAAPEQVLFDWYGLSGGQLKYYPKGASASYWSPVFSLEKPRDISLAEKAADYFPSLWAKTKSD